MKTSYKLWYVRRDNDVHISECAVRFYEGQIKTVPEGDKGKKMTRYVATRQLKQKDLEHSKENKLLHNVAGIEHIIYTDKDFGIISTEEELLDFLNKQLAKDSKREPVDKQKVCPQ